MMHSAIWDFVSLCSGAACCATTRRTAQPIAERAALFAQSISSLQIRPFAAGDGKELGHEP